MDQAFILGAGLGTRLRPLTNLRPKPLIPVFHKPMVLHSIEACMATGICRFAVNTHHLAEQWEQLDPPGGASLEFFQEPILLDTGGGLKNIQRWSGGKPLLVHNGDILTTLPLQALIDAHERSDNLVTLAVRSEGPPAHIAIDPDGSRVVDIRRMLDQAQGSHGFTGIYCVNPEFFELLPEREVVSIIPAFLKCIRMGRLGAAVIDHGIWLDLGDRASYLRAHHELLLAPAIDKLATIEQGVCIRDSTIGPGAHIGVGAKLTGCVVWPGARVLAGAELRDCVVATCAQGAHQNVDFA